MNSLNYSVTLITALGCGTIAGVFFAFSSFVMKALARLPPNDGIAAMQSINVLAVNSWFLAAFLGTAALCVLVIVAALAQWSEPFAVFLLLGGLAYLAGCFLVTVVFNVQAMIAEFGKPGAVFNMKQQSVDGEYAYILWTAETADNVYEMATDTLVVRDGKIVGQSFTGKITPKG